MLKSTEIQRTLSSARFSPYRAVTDSADGALELYLWNADVSAALLVPLHIYEVVMRNAIAEALAHVYDSRWPWSEGLKQSLPDNPRSFSSRKELEDKASRFAVTDKVVSELKFVFWQQLFTSRFNRRLWIPQLFSTFPNLGTDKDVGEHRANLHTNVENVRRLRNRVAHYEPIFTRDIASDLDTICDLIARRSSEMEKWLRKNEKVTPLLANKPPLIIPC